MGNSRRPLGRGRQQPLEQPAVRVVGRGAGRRRRGRRSPSSPDPSAQREAVARAREASEQLKAAARSMLPSGPGASRPPSPLKRRLWIAAPKHRAWSYAAAGYGEQKQSAAATPQQRNVVHAGVRRRRHRRQQEEPAPADGARYILMQLPLPPNTPAAIALRRVAATPTGAVSLKERSAASAAGPPPPPPRRTPTTRSASWARWTPRQLARRSGAAPSTR